MRADDLPSLPVLTWEKWTDCQEHAPGATFFSCKKVLYETPVAKDPAQFFYHLNIKTVRAEYYIGRYLETECLSWHPNLRIEKIFKNVFGIVWLTKSTFLIAPTQVAIESVPQPMDYFLDFTTATFATGKDELADCWRNFARKRWYCNTVSTDSTYGLHPLSN